jgi:hypothetical protein
MALEEQMRKDLDSPDLVAAAKTPGPVLAQVKTAEPMTDEQKKDAVAERLAEQKKAARKELKFMKKALAHYQIAHRHISETTDQLNSMDDEQLTQLGESIVNAMAKMPEHVLEAADELVAKGSHSREEILADFGTNGPIGRKLMSMKPPAQAAPATTVPEDEDILVQSKTKARAGWHRWRPHIHIPHRHRPHRHCGWLCQQGRKIKKAAQALGKKIVKGFKKAGKWIKKTAKKAGKWIKKTAKKVGKWVKKTYNKVKGWVVNGIRFLKMIIKLIWKAAKSVICILSKASKSMIGSFKDMTKNPKAFGAKFMRRVERLLPKMQKLLTRSASGAVNAMSKILSGDKIHPKALVKKVMDDVIALAKIEPVVGCAIPVMRHATKIMEGKFIVMFQTPEDQEAENQASLELIQQGGDGVTPVSQLVAVRSETMMKQDVFRKIMDWFVDVPWNRYIKPWVSDMFQKVMKSAGKTIGKFLMGEKAFAQVEGLARKAFTALKKTSVVTKALYEFNDSISPEQKKIAYQKISGLLKGKITFKDLAKSMVSGIRTVVIDSLMSWLEENSPRAFDWLLQKTTAALLSVASFIAEEILAEPVPLTMWGMEAIGSGVCEPLKAVWDIVVQVARTVFCETTNMLARNLVTALFGLADMGAQAVGGVLDKLFGKTIRWIGKAVEKWMGNVKKWVNMIPKPIRDIFTKIGKEIYDIVSNALAPDLKQFLDLNMKMLKSVTQSWVCAGKGSMCDGNKEMVLAGINAETEFAQEHTEESIKAELRGHLKVGFPDQQKQWMEELAAEPLDVYIVGRPKTAKWMHHHIMPAAKHAERPAVSFEQVVDGLRQLRDAGITGLRKGTPVIHKADVDTLVANGQHHIPTALDQLESVLSVSEKGSKVTTMVNKMRRGIKHVKFHIAAANTQLTQSAFVTEMIDYLKKAKDLIMCLINAGLKSATSLARSFRGKSFTYVVKAMAKSTSKLFKAIFKQLKATLKKQINLLDNALEDEELFTAATFNKMIMTGVNDFSKIEPALKCGIPLLKKFMGQISPKLDEALGKVKDFFEVGFEDLSLKAFNFISTKVIDPILAKIVGPQNLAKVKNDVEMAWDYIQRAVNTGIDKSLEHI